MDKKRKSGAKRIRPEALACRSLLRISTPSVLPSPSSLFPPSSSSSKSLSTLPLRPLHLSSLFVLPLFLPATLPPSLPTWRCFIEKDRSSASIGTPSASNINSWGTSSRSGGGGGSWSSSWEGGREEGREGGR